MNYRPQRQTRTDIALVLTDRNALSTADNGALRSTLPQSIRGSYLDTLVAAVEADALTELEALRLLNEAARAVARQFQDIEEIRRWLQQRQVEKVTR